MHVVHISRCMYKSNGVFRLHSDLVLIGYKILKILAKVYSRSVDPQKNSRNYLITLSILPFRTPRRSSLQRRSFDIYNYISAVGSKTKKLAVLP